MSEILNIAEGTYNLLLKKVGLSKTEIEWIAKIRLAHCEICTHPDGNACVSEEKRCRLCNCKIEFATRAPKKHCPLGKW